MFRSGVLAFLIILAESSIPGNRDDDAQFLIQATFGPTRAALAELGAFASYEDWIAAQIALNASLHRAFYREPSLLI